MILSVPPIVTAPAPPTSVVSPASLTPSPSASTNTFKFATSAFTIPLTSLRSNASCVTSAFSPAFTSLNANNSTLDTLAAPPNTSGAGPASLFESASVPGTSNAAGVASAAFITVSLSSRVLTSIDRSFCATAGFTTPDSTTENVPAVSEAPTSSTTVCPADSPAFNVGSVPLGVAVAASSVTALTSNPVGNVMTTSSPATSAVAVANVSVTFPVPPIAGFWNVTPVTSSAGSATVTLTVSVSVWMPSLT